MAGSRPKVFLEFHGRAVSMIRIVLVQRPDPAIQATVMHPRTGASFLLLPASQIYFSERRIGELVRIGNSEDIKEMIRQGGVPIGDRYRRRHAVSFIKYCMEGWEDDEHYVFFLVTDDKKQSIAGCFELRNRHRDTFETGYWVAQEYRGIGAASLLVLIDVCRSWQVGSLYAHTLETNRASRRLLEKAGFRQVRSRAEKGPYGTMLYYHRSLNEKGRR